ncbi:MAG: hypothetical protein KDD56_08640, partial [Bdellovibrionales bacterium]|nr:hypothetical protein [Bdellovibrionales bacterium]
SALAFLTKGPAAIILIGLPILILCYFEKSIKNLTSLPWVIGTLIFALISVPWFYFVERATPGSVSYFFLHENFLRFLTKDYGGRHGAAHIQPYGSIWWMMALAMLPWTFFLIKKPGLIFSKQIFSKLRKLDKWYVFVLACAFAPIVFFTFARSILPAYTLPAIPGLSLIIAKSIFSLEATNKEIKFKRLAKLFFFLFRPNLTANLGAAIVTIMMAGFYLSKPYIEVNKSSSELLEVIADNTKAKHPVVGIISTNNYSPYWTSGAHLEELSKPVRVIYVKPDEIENSKVKHLAVRESNNTNFLDNYGKHFERIALIGKWSWYRRK